MSNSKFCHKCGKELIKYTFKNNNILYNTITGKPYINVEERLVCPDHKDDIWRTNHTMEILDQYPEDVEQKP